MTACIGAICRIPNLGLGIVSCSDTRSVVPGFSSSDRTWKRETLGYRTFGLVSGQLSCGRELASMYREYLARVSYSELAEETVLDHFREPPRRLKHKLVEEYFRLKWAISYEEFLAGKLNSLRESELLRICSDVNNIVFPDGTAVVIGSLMNQSPLLFTVYPDGQVSQDENFAVVGSGYAIARATLCHRQYHKYFPLGAALYAVYEAKKLSEGDPNVGPDTAMWIDYLDGNRQPVFLPVSEEDLEFLASQFQIFGPKPIGILDLPPSITTNLSTNNDITVTIGDNVKSDEQKALSESAASGGGEGPKE
jgi:hypothetical protein